MASLLLSGAPLSEDRRLGPAITKGALSRGRQGCGMANNPC
jgi:hypothetical protein